MLCVVDETWSGEWSSAEGYRGALVTQIRGCSDACEGKG